MITSITKIDTGWRYTFSDTTAKDIFLNGEKIQLRYTDLTLDLFTISSSPPEIEVVTPNARAFNSWASEYVTIQWFRPDYIYNFAVQEYINNVLERQEIVYAPGPDRYYTHKIKINPETVYSSTWTVKSVERFSNEVYHIQSGPIPIVITKHYLPTDPALKVRYTENGKVEIYE